MTKREKLIEYLNTKDSDTVRDKDLEVAKTGKFCFVSCPMMYKDVTGVDNVYELGHDMDGDECVGNCEKCWKKVLDE